MKNFLIFAFILTLTCFAVLKIYANYLEEVTFQNEPVKIQASAAKKYIGENAIVSGTISEVFVSSQTTNVYLYLDGDIKHAQFAAVWLGTNNPPIKALEELIFRAEPTVSVSGKIITEKNLPEIIVNSWDQINQQPQ
jgi:hypothetical protein